MVKVFLLKRWGDGVMDDIKNIHKISSWAVEIREMKVDDLPEVLSIERISFRTPWSENLFREELFSPVCRSFVATMDGKVAGYVTFAIVLDEVHLRNISVHQDYRKCGIASKLLAHMIKISRENGLSWCTLEVRRSNISAIRLYEKFRFTTWGIRPRYYNDTREDALIMWADLRKLVVRP